MDAGELQSVAGPNAPAVLDRIAAQIVNEAHFALGEGIASADDINAAMRLGFNWPIGPLEWGERMGRARTLGVLELLRELHGDAYRAAPRLLGAVEAGVSPAEET